MEIIKNGEVKTLTLAVSGSSGVPINLTGASLFLGVKRYKTDGAYAFSKIDDTFDKTYIATGVISVLLTATDTAQEEGDYIGELKMTWSSILMKSADFPLRFQKAIT